MYRFQHYIPICTRYRPVHTCMCQKPWFCTTGHDSRWKRLPDCTYMIEYPPDIKSSCLWYRKPHTWYWDQYRVPKSGVPISGYDSHRYWYRSQYPSRTRTLPRYRVTEFAPQPQLALCSWLMILISHHQVKWLISDFKFCNHGNWYDSYDCYIIWKVTVALYDIIYDITYDIIYHKFMILAMISYVLICLWYHIPMISYAYDIMILYLWYHTTAVYDISNLWYHRSMISWPISYAKSSMISWNQNYDIILLNLWYQ